MIRRRCECIFRARRNGRIAAAHIDAHIDPLLPADYTPARGVAYTRGALLKRRQLELPSQKKKK